jgi:ABC-type branched-subunit amino acid transport system ATPase component
VTRSAPLLSVRGLTKSFGGLVALKNVDLDVERGEISGLIGPNGAGKTTLFNLVTGELSVGTGSVQLDGYEVTGLASHEIARLGLARTFQAVKLFASMTVTENVVVGAERHHRLNLWSALTHRGRYGSERREALRRAASAMSLVGVDHLAERPAASLSLGQQRLVAAARAMAAGPRLLLLDEPAASLSQPEVETLRDAIVRIRSAGASVLLVDHNVDLVMRLCDHVAVLHFGEKIADGSPAEVRASEAVTQAYLGR